MSVFVCFPTCFGRRLNRSIERCPFFVAHFFSVPQQKITRRQSVRNRKMRDALMETLLAAGVAESGCEKSVGDLLYTISTKVRERD